MSTQKVFFSNQLFCNNLVFFAIACNANSFAIAILVFLLLADYFGQTAKSFYRNVLSSITEDLCDQDRNYFFGQTGKSFRKNCCLSCSSMCHTRDEPLALQKIIMVEVSWPIQSRISRIYSEITVFARMFICQQRDSNAQPLSS